MLAALRRLFILPLDKTFLRLWKKHVYGYLQKYTDILFSECFEDAVLGHLEMV